MKHKVSELEGALLDAAVALAAGLPFKIIDYAAENQRIYGGSLVPDRVCRTPDGRGTSWEPSTSWTAGGPIIERERIQLVPDTNGNGGWCASHWGDVMDRKLEKTARCLESVQIGPTPLISAMRAYVASKFGEEVELP